MALGIATVRHFLWQEIAEWTFKIGFSVISILVGFNWADEYNWSILTQAFFWPTYGVFVYWIVIREVHFARKPEPLKPTGSVRIVFALKNLGFGTNSERDAIHRFTDKLDTLLTTTGVGEFDGDEFGEGQRVLVMYGDDPNAIYNTIFPAFHEAPFIDNGRVELRNPSSNTPYKIIEIRNQIDANK